ncbi:hypothetical protein GCM10018980_22770 [Streptomyces capoamus]|uniref:Uncharacterized protein n=1 Tax=Streptomyces capoamus TaxID=68183 RepID=A0A919C471_9ACTN|nr:hypothetical protein GCM10010501_01120 [Streptomyces libani subsp. rufus]GHG44650.1 hypothetical protein GCM10018980_22770 [Streptomyces capoamus]
MRKQSHLRWHTRPDRATRKRKTARRFSVRGSKSLPVTASVEVALAKIIMAVCQSFEVRREPVGKRVRAAIVLADDPGGDPAGRLL